MQHNTGQAPNLPAMPQDVLMPAMSNGTSEALTPAGWSASSTPPKLVGNEKM